MTIRLMKAALAASTVAALAFGASAANAATASATAKATILKQVTLTKTADLDFGTIVTAPTAGTVTISPAGAKTCPAPLVCTGTVAAAAFGIVGTTGQVVAITVPASVTLTSGSNNMTAALTGSAATRTLTGTDAVTVGGALSVGASQADGVYAGTFSVTVDYQ